MNGCRTLPLALLLVLVSLSCGDSTDLAPDAAPPTSFEATTSHGSYTVRIEPHPAPIPLNELFALSVTVTPQEGAAEPDDVAIDADMPEHKHGMNTSPEGKRSNATTWEIEGMLFHMPGAWELYVDVEAGGIVERAVLPVEMSTP